MRGSSGIVCVCVALALAAPVSALGAGPGGGPAISDDARAKFTAGVAFLTDPEGPRYEEAYRAFKAAYAESSSPKILGNLGLCAMKLERDDEAIASYEKYVTEMGSGLAKADLKQVTDDLATLKASVGHATVESDPPGAEIFDARIPVRGERVLNAYGTVTQPTKLGLHQGAHQITARLEGYPEQTWDVEVGGGQELPPHKFVFTKEAPPPVVAPPPPHEPPPLVTTRPIPTSVWIAGGVTGVFTAAAAVSGLLAMTNHNDFESAAAAKDVGQQQTLKDSGQTKNLIADTCLGGAVVAAVVTGVLYFTRPTVTKEAGSARNTLTIAPSVGASSASLGLQGSF
jgi:hypothetical protein